MYDNFPDFQINRYNYLLKPTLTNFKNNTEAFLPSLFGGVQLRGGLNLKFRYYLSDFLNHEFVDDNRPTSISNLSRYNSSQMMSISLSWQFLKDFKFRQGRRYDDDPSSSEM